MVRKALIVPPEQGRPYAMGPMRAVFKADGTETGNGYSISEWWLEPRTRLPNAHAHDEDHVFYVLEGVLSVQTGDDWSDAAQGSYVLIPGGTSHAFENRGAARAGFMAITVPGGFETEMPAIEEALANTDLSF